jgi:hypothetical protein
MPDARIASNTDFAKCSASSIQQCSLATGEGVAIERSRDDLGLGRFVPDSDRQADRFEAGRLRQ